MCSADGQHGQPQRIQSKSDEDISREADLPGIRQEKWSPRRGQVWTDVIQAVPVETVKDDVERKASKVRDTAGATKGEGIAPLLEEMTYQIPAQADGHEELQPTYIPHQAGHGKGHLDGGGLVREGGSQRNSLKVLMMLMELEVKYQGQDSMGRRRWVEDRGYIEGVDHGDDDESIKNNQKR